MTRPKKIVASLVAALALGLALTAGTAAIVAAAGASSTQTNVTSIGTTTTTGTDGWTVTEDAGNGGAMFISSVVSDPINNDGSLYLSTPTAQAHMITQTPTSGTIQSLSNVSYQTFMGTTGTQGTISLQFGLWCDATAHTGFNTFVFEPYLNSQIQATANGTWQTWNNVTTGTWWTSHAFTGGGGQANPQTFATLVSEYVAACPNNGLINAGLGMGTGNQGTEGWADNFAYTTSTTSANWNFQANFPAGATGPPGPAGSTGATGATGATGPTGPPATIPPTKGYWLAASDGGVFAYGGAAFYGSMAGQHLNAPIVAIVSSSDHKGYALVAKDGGVFTFGDFQYFGGHGGSPLNAPIIGAAAA